MWARQSITGVPWWVQHVTEPLDRSVLRIFGQVNEECSSWWGTTPPEDQRPQFEMGRDRFKNSSAQPTKKEPKSRKLPTTDGPLGDEHGTQHSERDNRKEDKGVHEGGSVIGDRPTIRASSF
jgi:hypothetical protein